MCGAAELARYLVFEGMPPVLLFVACEVVLGESDALENLKHPDRQVLKRDARASRLRDGGFDRVSQRELAVPVAHVARLMRGVLTVIGEDEELALGIRHAVEVMGTEHRDARGHAGAQKRQNVAARVAAIAHRARAAPAA